MEIFTSTETKYWAERISATETTNLVRTIINQIFLFLVKNDTFLILENVFNRALNRGLLETTMTSTFNQLVSRPMLSIYLDKKMCERKIL